MDPVLEVSDFLLLEMVLYPEGEKWNCFQVQIRCSHLLVQVKIFVMVSRKYNLHINQGLGAILEVREDRL